MSVLFFLPILYLLCYRSRSPDYRDRRKRPNNKDDFDRFRSKLNKIFFRDEDFIQAGTDEHRDFWKFLAKYQAYQKQKNNQPGVRKVCDLTLQNI